MTHDQSAPAHETPAASWQTEPPARKNVLLIIVSVVVVINTVLILALGVAVGFLWGERSLYADEMYMYPSDEDEVWMLADQMAMEVGFFIVDGDLDAYMDLYDAADPHVDLDTAESEFLEVAEKAQEAEGGIEYYSDMMPIVYEDEATGETIVRMTVSGIDYMSGRPAGGRLTIHILNDDGDMTLTGRDGRELRTTETIW